MRSRPIEHQFEFWANLGEFGGYIRKNHGYTALLPSNGVWPTKTFDLKNTDVVELKRTIVDSITPNAIALDSSDILNQSLINIGFNKTSVVDGMTLELTSNMSFTESSSISKVFDLVGVRVFSEIASEAFGYDIDSSSLAGLLKDENSNLFIGQHNNQFVSCGILFLDKRGDSGLHMIGAIKSSRGLGLGKEMTKHLLSYALKNKSTKVHLVASKLGAPIYRKYGFKQNGFLNSYTY